MEGQVLNGLEALIKGETPLRLYEAKKMEIDNLLKEIKYNGYDVSDLENEYHSIDISNDITIDRILCKLKVIRMYSHKIVVLKYISTSLESDTYDLIDLKHRYFGVLFYMRNSELFTTLEEESTRRLLYEVGYKLIEKEIIHTSRSDILNEILTNDYDTMKFNTAVATFMTMVNEFYKEKQINKAEYKTFLQLLNPFAPHITEELFKEIGESTEISNTPWPVYDESKTIDDEIEIPVQVNGKLKTTIKVEKEATETAVKEIVMNNDTVKELIKDKTVVKEIYVKGKIFNIVVK